MIQIENKMLKTQKNFWCNAVFHPTDAIEDPWGKRILDQIANDGALNTVRIYAMFEDIVYLDEKEKLCFDFRLSDLRLDYLVSKGYSLLIAYAGIPDCIAESTLNKTSVSKNKTRYKGKMWNTSAPNDFSLWEEICYQYTAHIIERYGIEKVKSWKIQCFNEPDINSFFCSNLPAGDAERLEKYCILYKNFVNGVLRASKELKIGGPALANEHNFLKGFLSYIKSENLRLDFISIHSYGTTPYHLNNSSPYCIDTIMETHYAFKQILSNYGLSDLSYVIDEWGMASAGFYNRDECPALMAREHELFSAYFVKLIRALIYSDIKVDLLAICLSGQHEMVEDFSGFRNFFTLNFIKKPIYNAYILASKLGETLLCSRNENENIAIIPTKLENGSYAVLLSYSSKYFDENFEQTNEEIKFPESISKKNITVWCINKENTNPYRLYQKMNIQTPDKNQLQELRAEGNLKPFNDYLCDNDSIKLTLTANSTFLITVE